MVPHKTARGAAALDKLKTFEGIPHPYAGETQDDGDIHPDWESSCWESVDFCGELPQVASPVTIKDALDVADISWIMLEVASRRIQC